MKTHVSRASNDPLSLGAPSHVLAAHWDERSELGANGDEMRESERSSMNAVSRGHDFGRIDVHTPARDVDAPSARPSIRVRGAAPLNEMMRGIVRGVAAPDKSTSEEGTMQDQSASVTSFTATANGVGMRADMEGAYSSDEYPDSFKWTQTIDTNAPLGGTTSPYVDPRPNDDTKPFYWTDAEQAAHPTEFIDYPSRPAPATGTTNWDATLCLNGVNDSTKTVTAFDALSYGFSIDTTGTVTMRGPTSVGTGPHQSVLSSEFPDWTFN